MSNDHRFVLGHNVRLVGSTERGQVIARAHYLETAAPQYLVRYVAGDGRLTEAWWSEHALIDDDQVDQGVGA